MKQKTPQDRAALLWRAAGGKQSMTLDSAAKALGIGRGHAMSVVKRLILADEISIPLMEDYEPNLKRTATARRERSAGEMQAPPPDRLTAPLGVVTVPQRESEPGEFMQADDELVEVEIWPPRAGLPKKAKCCRLR